MDLLADVLARTGVRGSAGARISAGQDWGVSWAGPDGPALYALTAGTAWVGVPGDGPRQLVPGDVLLLADSTAHTLLGSPDATIDTHDCANARRAQEARAEVHLGRGAAQTHLLSATFSSDTAASTQVLSALPGAVHVHAERGGGLDDALRLLGRELERPGMASSVLLDRLIDVLLIQLLRDWIAGSPAEAAGSWLGLLCDPVVRDAITALHEDPARPWTTDLLASRVAVSRATLTRRFLHAAGEPPGGYLTRWRMDLAAARLRDGDDTLEAIARSVGYTSVHAFSRAFSRVRGRAPGRYRLDARR
ncbi:AraC family transcriptional regulator [Saccharopolyspora gregorii]|uniref:AraC family transcriptional regulator n=1 Tax=Saccharopolyspora gregorii TaxID=33914 RepID=A0ABP6RPW4_9PSEU